MHQGETITFFSHLIFLQFLMEFDTKYKEDRVYQPILQPNNYIKPEFDNEFSMDSCSSKGFFQDNLDDQFSFTGSSSSFIYSPNNFGAAHTFFDRFDPFTFPSSTNLDLCDQFKPLEENGSSTVMQNNYQVGGFFNNHPKRALVEVNASGRSIDPFDSSQDMKPMNLVVPDEGSCVTADNHNKKLGAKENSFVKPSKTKKKSNSSKGQWTSEEDR